MIIYEKVGFHIRFQGEKLAQGDCNEGAYPFFIGWLAIFYMEIQVKASLHGLALSGLDIGHSRILLYLQ